MRKFLEAIRFPLRDGHLSMDVWLYHHLLFQWVLFAIALKVFGFHAACLTGLWYPLRAAIWKTTIGHDPKDPWSDIIWGALIPSSSVLIVFLIWR